MNKEISSSKFIPHVIFVKQSELFETKEMRIVEKFFEFKRVRLNKEVDVFPNLEYLGNTFSCLDFILNSFL